MNIVIEPLVFPSHHSGLHSYYYTLQLWVKKAFSIFQLQAQLARKNTHFPKELLETKTEFKIRVNIRQRFIREQKHSK